MRLKPIELQHPAWLRRVRFRHLEILLTIARHGSLTAAGVALGMTQPAVSQWLADIESAIGAPLFVRGQRLRPTPFAGPVLAHAERVINDARSLVDEIGAIRAGQLGRVRIGAMQVASSAIVPQVILRLRAELPHIEIFLIEDIAAGLWERFGRNEIDLLVTRLDERTLRSEYPCYRLFADRHRIVCGPKHPLAGRRRLNWRDVQRFPWLMPPKGTPLREAIERSFATAQVSQPPILLELNSATANLVLLRACDALGVLSSTAAEHQQAMKTLSVLPLALSHDIGDVGLVWRDAVPSPALARVIQEFREPDLK